MAAWSSTSTGKTSPNWRVFFHLAAWAVGIHFIQGGEEVNLPRKVARGWSRVGFFFSSRARGGPKPPL
jgi:hypothetical protein